MDPTEIITKLGGLQQAHLKEQQEGGCVRFKNPEELHAILDLESDDGKETGGRFSSGLRSICTIPCKPIIEVFSTGYG